MFLRFNKFLILSAVVFFAMSSVSYAESAKKDGDSNAKEYVRLDPLILPVIDNDGIYQVISMVVSLEVSSLAEADKIKAAKPRLADAYIQDMYGVLNAHEALKGGVLQVGLVKERLRRVTNKILGKDVHAEVLLQAVQQRPI